MDDNNHLYRVTRYYAQPAEVFVIAPDKKTARKLSNKTYGKPEHGQKARRVKYTKARVLLLA